MQTAEEILIANYYVEMNGDDTASIIKAMKAYAMQECEKVRQDCADNAKVKGLPQDEGGYLKIVDLDSILSTPITLT